MGVEGEKISNTFYLNDNKMYNIISEEIGTVLGLSDADGNLLFMGLAIDGKPGLFLVDENENILFTRPN